MKQAAIIMTLLLVSGAVWAQEEPAEPTLILSVEPSELNLKVGEKATLVATVLDDDGNIVERPVVFFSRRRRSVSINPAGNVEAYRPGEHVLIAMLPKDPEESPSARRRTPDGRDSRHHPEPTRGLRRFRRASIGLLCRNRGAYRDPSDRHGRCQSPRRRSKARDQ